MKLQLIAKIGIVAALGIASSFVTAKLLARMPLGGKLQIPNTKEVYGPSQVIRSSIPAVATAIMHGIEINVVNGGIHVKASGHIRDTRPDWAYVWSVRLTKSGDDDHALFEKRYDSQLFRMPASNETDITFDDTIAPPLAPGVYLVRAVVYAVPPGGLANLGDLHARGMRAASSANSVTIGN